jgi:sugar O-acyltransferase (sialic acid O-acetyltransferase NeuD family)
MTDALPGLRMLGAGGHAAVAADAWEEAGGRILAFHADGGGGGPADPLPIADAIESGDMLHIAIGRNEVRRRLSDGIEDGRFPPVRHPTAIVSRSAAVSAGVLVCAAAILQPRCRIGRHTIVNTAALVEHDCVIGDYVHIAPGVRLAGNVSIGDGAFVGIGASVIPGIRIGADAVVGAGAVVIRDVEPGAVVAGNPARALR